MGTQRVQMKKVLPWLLCWPNSAGTRDFCPALAAALVDPVQNNFFLTEHFINSFPHRPTSWAAVLLGRLSLNVCLTVSDFHIHKISKSGRLGKIQSLLIL